jgi:hypothetical protein
VGLSRSIGKDARVVVREWAAMEIPRSRRDFAGIVGSPDTTKSQVLLRNAFIGGIPLSF